MMDLNLKIETLENEILKLGGRVHIAYHHFPSSFSFYYNENSKIHAASIIKLLILYEFYRQVDSGALSLKQKLTYKPSDLVDGSILQELHRGVELTIEDLANLMVVVSDNSASNILIELVGKEKINALATQIGMDGTKLNKKFMLPLEAPELYNYTTASDMLLLLKSIYLGELISTDSRAAILKTMSRQQFREKIPRFFPDEFPIANKTGEVSGVRHDCGYFLQHGQEAALVVATTELKDEYAGDLFIGEVARTLYKYSSSL